MKTVIEMAREAGLRSAVLLHMWGKEEALCDSEIEELRQIERFAALVIANRPPQSSMAWQEGFEAGRLAEREACAKVCEDMEEKAEGTECCKWPTPVDCAHAIRARGN